MGFNIITRLKRARRRIISVSSSKWRESVLELHASIRIHTKVSSTVDQDNVFVLRVIRGCGCTRLDYPENPRCHVCGGSFPSSGVSAFMRRS